MKGKKLIAILVLVLSVFGLVGCGDKVATGPTDDVVVKWNGATIEYGGNVLTLSSIKSGYAEVSSDISADGNGYTFMLDSAKDVTNITVNTQGVLQENMDKYKDMFYYTEYLNSKCTGAFNIQDDYWAVGQCANTMGLAAGLLATNIYNQLTVIPLTNGALYVDCGGMFTFGDEWSDVELRPEKCLIPGIIQVLPGTKAEPTGETTIMQGDKAFTLGTFSTESFDYYTYGGFTIQAAKGVNITTYIKFATEE